MTARTAMLRLIALLFGFVFLDVHQVGAEIRTVPSPYSTIQAAIDASQSGDIVLVDDGTYVEYIDFLDRVLTVKSVNGPDATIIQSPPPVYQRPVVRIVNNGVGSILEGFTIQGGLAQNGGGIYILASAPTVRNCVVRGSLSGGGVFCDADFLSAPITFSNCYITGNFATPAPAD